MSHLKKFSGSGEPGKLSFLRTCSWEKACLHFLSLQEYGQGLPMGSFTTWEHQKNGCSCCFDELQMLVLLEPPEATEPGVFAKPEEGEVFI